MGDKFLRIDDRKSLEDVISNSTSQPVVIFKHSNSCPISSMAYREMEQFDGQVNLVEVQAARDISRELADITGVRHETPQVIVLRNGKAVWNASHFDVKAGAVSEALQATAKDG
jgi:monothiol bacilliredoxin